MWYSPFSQLPTNGQTVWIRIASNPTEPVQSTYNSATQIFTTVATGLTVPAINVSKWKNI